MKISSSLSALLLALTCQGAQSQSLRQAAGKGGEANIAPHSDPNLDAHTISRSLGLVQSSGLSWDLNTAFEKGPGFEYLVDFGFSVSISGDGNFMAAAPKVTPEFAYSGIVRFYMKNATSGGWDYNSDLNLGGLNAGDAFGAAVALGYDGINPTVAIGAYGDDGALNAKSQSGSVTIFKLNPSKTSWDFQQIIHGEAAFDNSGVSLSLSNDAKTLAIGATLNQGNFTDPRRRPGHVRVYRDDGTGTFTKIGQDIDGTGPGDHFGYSVALSEDGSRLAVGANQLDISDDEDIGTVQIFELTNPDTTPEWVKLGDDITGIAFGDQMGDSVAINCKGTIVAVGATQAYDTTQSPEVQRSGEVKVYKWDGSAWNQIGQTIYGEADEAELGSSVAMTSSGYVLAIGAPLTQGGSPNVWVYDEDNDVWSILAGSIGGVGGLVVDISADASTLAIGDPEIAETVTIFDLSGEGDRIPAGCLGDPHFKTWRGEHFEYHGQCDMILAKDATFADGLGLDIQIRTKLVRFWSYIKNAAIRIGDDILEIEGTADTRLTEENNHYWFNFEYQAKLNTIGGFPIKYFLKDAINAKRWFEIDLSSKYPGQKIVISSYKEFIKVDYQGATAESVGNAVGMLGNFYTGDFLARDGVTKLDDFTEHGNEWQVLPHDDHMLFHDVAKPQFPEKCIEPEDPRGERRRRLDESLITEEQAEAACASLADPLDRKDCVYDILATQDIGMVGAF
eukprot:scaffold609_cov130-Cylindrotheca_fusiformis.AAC.2